MDRDNVWVFWAANISFEKSGNYTLNARAKDIGGNMQPPQDPEKFEGTNIWTSKRIIVA